MTKSSARHIDEAMARTIKRLLWEGFRQGAIAEHFGVSQPSISRIANGKDFKTLPWPDGSVGALSRSRKTSIRGFRRTKRMIEKMSGVRQAEVITILEDIEDGEGE